MKTKLRLAILWLALLLALTATAHAQGNGTVIVITAEGPVTPVMVSHIERGIRTAEERNAEALIIQLNTPGGQTDLMDRVVASMLDSDKPVIVYVSPSGAMAGSAGTVITLAAHANAMAPQTIIGAASPVGGQGEDLGETLEAKLKEAIKAQVRTLAARRSEEAIKLAESTIDEAKAVTADEAKAAGLTDFIATNLPDLLNQLDGYTVNVHGSEVTLHTQNAIVEELDLSLLEEILGILTNPNVIFLLLAIGAQAILIELSSPGGWVAGFIGAVCLALAFYGLGVLPVNWFGIIFIVIAFALFILDVNAPTHGALTAAAVASLIVGALVLFNSPGSLPYLQVSVPLVIATSVIMGGVFFLIIMIALRTRKLPAKTGVEGLKGKTGFVTQPLNPRGIVQVESEEWSAEAESGTIEVGAEVTVVEVKGLRLKVKKG